MQYEIFKNLVLDQIRGEFQESTEITVHTLKKNNGLTLDGLVILEDGINISPTIYLNFYYEQYKNGTSFSEILSDILEDYRENKPPSSVDISFYMEFENIKDKIVYKLVHYEKNKELLKSLPHIQYLDLAIIFYCLLQNDEKGTVTIEINSQHMARWKVGKDQLLELASQNTPQLLEYDLKSIDDVLEEGLHIVPPDLPSMFILTNQIRSHGACCMLYDNLLSNLAEEMETDFYILPSSIHEVILVPTDGKHDMPHLSGLVHRVNESAVLEEEILADHAYYYSRKNDCVSM